ncbi:hypothetical protein WDU94_001705 [Cyamophila willieti]
METSLSNANKEIIQKCKKKANITLFGVSVSLVIAIALNSFDKLHSLSEKEIEELKFIYRTQQPGRRLLFNVWVPFVDETKAWYYEVIFALHLWPMALLHLYNTGMFLTISVCSMCLSLCLYQLTLSSGTLSKITLYKYAFEFIGVTGDYFYLCYCSDTLDDCHAMLRRAITDSDWYRCSNKTKQDLCIFLRRLQRPNHLRFNQGFIVLSKEFFVKVVKVSYSFVNFLRLKSK